MNERHGIAAGVRVAFGDTFAELEARAAELPADLVVLGAHGTSALPRLVVGSKAARMAAGSRCPVLVVKGGPSGPYRNVLIPVDFSAQSLPALRTASARLLACHGEALHQILEQERERKCDLIIMGRHGEAPLLEQVVLGSVTKQVLAQSRADVLVATGE